MPSHSVVLAFFLFAAASASLVPGFRPPAVPLVVQSPYQSIWSYSNNLTDSWSAFWGGPVMALLSAVRVDGVPYRLMGPGAPSGIDCDAMPQVSVEVNPTRTVYEFEGAGVGVTLSFTTPALLHDLSALELPVTFIEWTVRSVDGARHSVQVYYDNTAEVAVAMVTDSVVWERVDLGSGALQAMRIGTEKQPVLGEKGDAVKIGWGYQYAVTSSGARSTAGYAAKVREAFVQDVALPEFDQHMPRPCDVDWPVLAYEWDLATVDGATQRSVSMMYAYDEILVMDYFADKLAPHWRHTFNGDPKAMLVHAAEAQANLTEACVTFDQELVANLTAVGGDEYATLAALAYRQTTGASTLAWSSKHDGPWVFLKEISSDGDVSTVDVLFPSSPLWLSLENGPELLRLLLVPVLEYANNATSIPYNLSWAPHHLGVWPVCDIKPMQQEQMPMEETGNMLQMIAAIAQEQMKMRSAEDALAYLAPYWPLLHGWARYLTLSLPDPGDQLCSDDFEGPSPHNVNLAAKGVVGLASYALLLKWSGQPGVEGNLTQARQFEKYWEQHAVAEKHSKLQFNLNSTTWSQVYNLFFHYVLAMDVFPASVMQANEAFYEGKMQAFGLPLDDRSLFTKTDWSSWVGAMCSDAFFAKVNHATFAFANETPSRVPLSDWYWTNSSDSLWFRARPVVGGLYAKYLLEQQQYQR